MENIEIARARARDKSVYWWEMKSISMRCIDSSQVDESESEIVFEDGKKGQTVDAMKPYNSETNNNNNNNHDFHQA